MERTLFEPEHEHFRESVRTFLDRHVIPNHLRWREQRRIDREAWTEAGRHDFLGISMPAELGGGGVDDFRFNVVLSEELAAIGLALASSFGIHTDVVAPYLSELASEQQQQRWVPAFCSGELVTAIGMTEAGAGSDLAAIRTTASREGEDWLLSGSKTFITNGMSADLVVVAARTGEASRAISLFAVEAASPGFERGRKLEKAGQPEADTAELFFENVRLPADALLGEVDRGFAAMMERLPQERLHTAVSNVAHAGAALASTLVYVKDRRAFGRPVGSFQSSRFLLAELATELDVTQAYVDRCVELHVEHRLSPIDAAKAKWWSAEVQNRVIDACVQLHGGYGYMTEYDVTRAWLDARVSKIWAGSNEIMKEIIGRDLGLGDPHPA
ncbi:MAG: acyl-CoA dehydrogenase family protein [Thermoleophilia bacterium]|nr:acyl-CoA dehydrogenase family protein [Thermoleophilia bacterium]